MLSLFLVYARTGDENKGPGVEEPKKNGRPQNRDSDSDDSSPTLSNKLPSGPYIPISECFTGKPLPKSETYPVLGGGDVTYSNSSVFQFPPKVNWATHPSKRLGEHTDSDATLTPTPTSADGNRGGGRLLGGVVAPPRPPKPRRNGSPVESSPPMGESSPRSPIEEGDTATVVSVQVSPPNSAGAVYCNISDVMRTTSSNNSPTDPPPTVTGGPPPPPPVVDRNLKPPPPDARPFPSPTNGSPTGRLPPSYASGTMTLPSRGGQYAGSGSGRQAFFAGPVIDRTRKPPEGRPDFPQSQSHHLSLGPTPAQIKSSGGPGVSHGRSMSSSGTQQYNQRTLPSSSSSPRRAGPILSPNEKRPFIYHEYEQAEEMKGTYLQIQCQPTTHSVSQSHGKMGDSPKFSTAIPANKGRGLGVGERGLRKGVGGGALLHHPIDPNGSVEYRMIDPVKTKALNRTIEDREKQLRNNTLSKNHH